VGCNSPRLLRAAAFPAAIVLLLSQAACNAHLPAWPAASLPYEPTASFTIAVLDDRGGTAWPPPADRNHPVKLDADDALADFTRRLLGEMQARGMTPRYVAGHDADLVLQVRTLHRHLLGTPRPTRANLYTALRADLRHRGKTHTVVAYFQGLAWMVRPAEGDMPAVDIPLEALVKEVASDINRAAIGARADEAQVETLIAEIGTAETEDYLRVLELGYTNNPGAAVPALVRLADVENQIIQMCVAISLGNLGEDASLPVLARLHETSGARIRLMALKSILELDSLQARSYVRDVKASHRYRSADVRELVDWYERDDARDWDQRAEGSGAK